MQFNLHPIRFALTTFAALCLLAPAFAVEPAADPAADPTDPLRAGEYFSGAKGWLNTTEPVTNAQLKGQIVLVDFWTYCCINCIHVMPELKWLEEKYKDQPFVVIGVHSGKFDQEKNLDNIRAAVLRNGLKHPVAVDNDFAIWQRFGSHSWPTLVLIDSTGKPIGQISGEGHRDLLDRAIAKLLETGKANGTLAEKPLKFKEEVDANAQGTLSFPGKIRADVKGQRLFITDTGHHRILETGMDGVLRRVIGSGHPGLENGALDKATFNEPQGVCLSDDGLTLYVCDRQNHALRAVDLASGQVRTLAGTGAQGRDRSYNGVGKDAVLNSPWDIERVGNTLFIAMAGHHQIWRYDLSANTIAVHSGTGAERCDDGPLLAATFSQPCGVVSDGQKLFIADSEDSTVRAVAVDPSGEVVSVAGSKDLFGFGLKDGVGIDARFQHPQGITLIAGAKGPLLVVTDTYNHALRTVDPTSGEVTTLKTAGLTPGFYEPGGLCSDAKFLYVADTNHHRIVRLNFDGSGAQVLTVTLPAAK
jgi:thiol-disulfide isomerase/thioredoxin